MNSAIKGTCFALALATALPSAWSAEREDLETLRQTTLSLVQALVQGGVLTQEKADELMRNAQRSAAEKVAAEKKGESRVVRVPYVPQHVRNEIKEELRQEVMARAKGEGWAAPGAVPEWTTRLKLSGDLRLRHQVASQSNANFNQYVSVQDTNNSSAEVILNTTQNITQDRLRLRLALDIQVSDTVTAGVGLATGNSTNPVSTNQTLGTGFNRYSVAIDRAFIKYDPVPWLSAIGGRMPNPFFSTDLVWDEDLAFEGIAATFKPKFGERSQAFLTLGMFPLDSPDCSLATALSTCKRRKSIDGAQVGFEHGFGRNNRLKLGLAQYNFSNISGTVTPIGDPTNKSSLPKWAQKGNTVFNVRSDGGTTPPLYGLAADFREVNLTGSLDLGMFDPTRVVLTADYVENTGFDRAAILQRSTLDVTPRTKGYFAGLLVGQPRIQRRGDWAVNLGYKHLERDAVVDGYTDSDFHLGGTDAKGWILGASYGIENNTALRLRWLTANAIDGPPLAIDVLQLDLNSRF